MVTVVAVATTDVAIGNVAVNEFAGAVVVAGTLATAGWLLDSDMTAPPSGAPTLRTTVPLEAFPPTTVDGFVVHRGKGRGRRRGLRRETAHGRPGARLAGGIDTANPPEMRRGRQVARRVHGGRDGLLAHERRGEGAGLVDLNRVRQRAGHVAPIERDWLRRRLAVGGGEQSRRGRQGRRRGRRRRVSRDRDLRHERVAPENCRVAVEHGIERADRRGEIQGVGVAGHIHVADGIDREVVPDVRLQRRRDTSSTEASNRSRSTPRRRRRPSRGTIDPPRRGWSESRRSSWRPSATHCLVHRRPRRKRCHPPSRRGRSNTRAPIPRRSTSSRRHRSHPACVSSAPAVVGKFSDAVAPDT